MAGKEPQKFGLGAYWPDDYTDYVVHFQDPFVVFRIESDRNGPLLLWGSPSDGLASLDDHEFSHLLEAAETFLALEGVGELSGERHAEYRESHVPFPPCLVVSNRSNAFSAVVGLGEKPFAAYFNPDETGPLFIDIDFWFEEKTESLIEQIGRSAESYYEEFYERQMFLDAQENEKKGRGFRGDPGMHSKN
jgi:hypothetical protein